MVLEPADDDERDGLDKEAWAGDDAATADVRVRFHITRNARIENVGKSQSCVSKVRIRWNQTDRSVG